MVNGRDRWWRREIDEWAESRKRPDAVPGRSRRAEKLAVGRQPVLARYNWVSMQITLNVPQDVADGLATKWTDLPRAALESLALEGYRAGALMHAQVRRLLGFGTRGEVDGFLKQHGVYLEYTLDDLAQDTSNSRLASR
jgi:Uncharacterised protein family (UPF0175)